MSWGVYYTYDGYLSHLSKNELENELENLKRVNELMWREILAYMAATPPAVSKDPEGEEYPTPEFFATKIKDYRDTIEENMTMITHIEDCLEAIKENPDKVTEG